MAVVSSIAFAVSLSPWIDIRLIWLVLARIGS